jgi:hypothetical protein
MICTLRRHLLQANSMIILLASIVLAAALRFASTMLACIARMHCQYWASAPQVLISAGVTCIRLQNCTIVEVLAALTDDCAAATTYTQQCIAAAAMHCLSCVPSGSCFIAHSAYLSIHSFESQLCARCDTQFIAP